MRRVEQAVRETDEKRWASNPEAAARAQSLVDQLEKAVEGLRKDLEKAEASGNTEDCRCPVQICRPASNGWRKPVPVSRSSAASSPTCRRPDVNELRPT